MTNTIQYETGEFMVVEVNEMFMIIDKETGEESILYETVEEAIAMY